MIIIRVTVIKALHIGLREYVLWRLALVWQGKEVSELLVRLEDV